MRKNLFDNLDIRPENTFIENGKAEDTEAERRRYDGLLDKMPQDIQLLGLGSNGHIAFNEPYTPFGTGTHVVKLTDSTIKDGQARLKDGTLAGSVLKMNAAVKNLVTKCGADIGYAIDCATYNPAKNLGLEKEYGIIRDGAFADFALLDGNFNVALTVVGGEIVYRA